MDSRSVLTLFLAASLFAPASRAADADAPAVLSVAVSGLQSGVTVMAYWLEKPLFEREVPQSSAAGAPFVFSVEASPGTGQLKVWSFHKARGGGGTAVFQQVALRSGSRYKLAVSPNDGYKLRVDIADD